MNDEPACASWGVPDGDVDLWEWQDNRCGICGYLYDLVLDHDHDTGLLRGYLCRSCNRREGLGHDAPAFVAWREGVNSAALLGIREVYIDPFTRDAVIRSRRAPSADVLRRGAEAAGRIG